MYTTRSCRALMFIVMACLVAACGTPATPPTANAPAAATPSADTPTLQATTAIEETTTPPSAARADADAQMLTIAVADDAGVLNPHTYEAGSFIALTMLYEPLVRYAADGTLTPGLAESWTISDDGLEWTFKLRSGVRFSDGTPLDAAAAKWNLERWVGVEDHSWLPASATINAIETPDDQTVVLRMSTYYYTIMQDLALVRPVRFLSPKAVDDKGAFSDPIGTGPWKVQSYTPDQQLVFEPNPHYWGTKPTLERVVLEVIPDPQTRVAALQSGDVDLIGGEYIGGIPLESIAVLQSDPNVQVLTEPGSTSYLLQMNPGRPPFDDELVRRAVNHALDRTAISQQVFRGFATPATGIFPDTVPYVTHPQPERYAYDAAQARTLLDQAGWTAGADGMRAKDGEPLSVSLIFNGAVFPQAKSMAEVIQAELKDVGITVQTNTLESGAFYDALGKGEYDLAINVSWGSPYDPHSSLSALFRSTDDDANHRRFYTSAELDKLIDTALSARDENERQATFNQIWNVLDDHAAGAPVVYSQRIYALRKGVEGFKLAGTEYELDLSGVRIAAP
jgi:nickel ABC transporter nickel/metallophore binding protein